MFLSLSKGNHFERSASDIHHAIEICRTYAAMSLLPTSPDIGAQLFTLLAAGYVFAGNKRYKGEFGWVHETIQGVVREAKRGLQGFRGFFEQVKEVHEALPEWVCVDDIDVSV